jgi:N-methylhydantoinase A/oxoprolinase/acetone carboxylase beta subunit/N-methylhydantoinase B/oxoprolinase/acetone carboxylase alpha subunit
MSAQGDTFRIGVDIGGTFTDCAVLDSSGRRTASKALTVPDGLERGVLTSLETNARERGLSRGELLRNTELFVHSTTQATNALLVRQGSRTGLITTIGHEDALIIGRVYAKMAGLSERDLVHSSRLEKPEPIIPRELIRGVTERVDRDGDVLVALDEDDVTRAIDDLLAAGCEAIAVCLLWSFANDSHERLIKRLLAERAPTVFASFSHEVAPRMGEYERAATTAINAYVGPKVIAYLETLEAQLRSEGLAHAMLVMQASGGLTSVADAARRPIVTLDSGPTGGILGCQHLGQLYGEDNLVCTDVGGTSFDVGLVLNGRPPLDSEPVVDQYSLRFPKILVRSIGSGGGSIAWRDENGLLRVGPQSAGSSPGPACYGLGGAEPTVTDADLVLGHISPTAFLGGTMHLDLELALQALSRLGDSLGMTPEEVAVGISRIINAQMADLIRKSTIERGLDPRETVVVAYGGAGPTHAVGYAHEIGSRTILVPGLSTVFSAAGLLTCDISHTAEMSRRVVSPYSEEAAEDITRRFGTLEQLVLDQFAQEGADVDTVRLTRSLGVRFRQQVHMLELPLHPGPVTQETLDGLVDRFIVEYGRIYGDGALLGSRDTEIELHRVVGTQSIDSPALPTHPDAGEDPSPAHRGVRKAHFDGVGFVTADVFDGEALQPGNCLPGPCLIERMGDTVVVPPGYHATVDPYLTLRIDHETRRNESAPSNIGWGRTSDASDGLDPVTFEVIRHRLWAINDDQATMAARLSGSPIVYDAFDFNAALVTADGRGLYTGVYIMHHGATIDEFVGLLLAEWDPADIHEGDMFFSNDPWWGALHGNDGILAMPIFWEQRLVAWAGIVMHDNDVGSSVPGSWVTGARNRFDEAPLFPAVKLVEGFEVRRDIERLYLRNSRTADLNALNMRARVAALRNTDERIHALIGQYGIAAFLAAQEGILDHVEQALRRRLLEIPDGSWYTQGYHDHDGNSDAVYRLCCRLTKVGDRLVFDTSGTSLQAPGPINCARPALVAATMGVILSSLCYDLPWAIGGVKRVTEIRSEPGRINSAADPAATSMASIAATLSTQDTVADVVARMLLCSEDYCGEAQATWSPGVCTGSFAAVNGDGEYSVTPIGNSFGGGGGARTFVDGIDTGGVMHSMASRIPNVETVESRSPLLQLYRRQQRDGGGAGRHRGGAGIEFAVIPHKTQSGAVVNTLASGVAMPAGHGLSGGRPGAAVANIVLRGANVRELFELGRIPQGRDEITAHETHLQAAKELATLDETDVLLGAVSSGAGYGDPLRRDPTAVARDVTNGLVSSWAAQSIYGVVLADGAVVEDQTIEQRDALRRGRLMDARPGPEVQVAETRIEAAASLHPVSDTVEAVRLEDGALALRCTICRHRFGDYSVDLKAAALVRELSLIDMTAANSHCQDSFALREYCCPGCGTAIETDIQSRVEPPLATGRLGGI